MNTLKKRIDRLERKVPTEINNGTEVKQYKYTVWDWPFEEYKRLFFEEPKELIEKANETDFSDLNNGYLREFLSQLTDEELQRFAKIVEEIHAKREGRSEE